MTVKDDEELLRQYRETAKVKISDWTSAAIHYFRVERKKVDRTKKWNFEANRLPNPEEIFANRGWLSVEEEKVLQKFFIENFRTQVSQEIQLNTAQLEGTLGVLYGIYLMNYVLGGLLINKYFDYFSFSKWENQQWTKKAENLDPNNLKDWPVSISDTESRSESSANNWFGVSIKMNVGAKRYKNEKPYQRKKISIGEKIETVKKLGGLIKKQEKVPEIEYTISEFEESILTGIEEAHHSLLHYFQFVHEIKTGNPDLRENSVIEVIDSALSGFSKSDRLNYVLTYSASRFHEYVAELTQATYVEKYLPEVWSSGFKNYIAAITAKRKELLKNKKESQSNKQK